MKLAGAPTSRLKVSMVMELINNTIYEYGCMSSTLKDAGVFHNTDQFVIIPLCCRERWTNLGYRLNTSKELVLEGNVWWCRGRDSGC